MKFKHFFSSLEETFLLEKGKKPNHKTYQWGVCVQIVAKKYLYWISQYQAVMLQTIVAVKALILKGMQVPLQRAQQYFFQYPQYL